MSLWTSVQVSAPSSLRAIPSLVPAKRTLGADGSSARALVETVFADVNGLGVPVVAIDLPTGVSADTHEVEGEAIEASMTVTLRGAGLTEGQVVDVARHGEKVALAASARTRMERSRARVEKAAASREPVYGVSTGFGALAGTRVAPLRQPGRLRLLR